MPNTESMPDSTPGNDAFPQFGTLYDLVTPEVQSLTNEQLDWESEQWEWAKWSIRRQVSHMASFIPGWLLRQWGSRLFPDGFEELGELQLLVPEPDTGIVRWLDETKYRDLDGILLRLDKALALARYVLSRETLGEMKVKEVPRPNTPPHWPQFVKAHPRGVRWHPTETLFTYVTLEATFRHLYFEVITHLYNVQRLKRAQGLPTVVEIPYEGYWALPDWDRSEATD